MPGGANPQGSQAACSAAARRARRRPPDRDRAADRREPPDRRRPHPSSAETCRHRPAARSSDCRGTATGASEPSETGACNWPARSKRPERTPGRRQGPSRSAWRGPGRSGGCSAGEQGRCRSWPSTTPRGQPRRSPDPRIQDRQSHPAAGHPVLRPAPVGDPCHPAGQTRQVRHRPLSRGRRRLRLHGLLAERCHLQFGNAVPSDRYPSARRSSRLIGAVRTSNTCSTWNNSLAVTPRTPCASWRRI